MIRPFKTVLFDLDGTLLDTAPDLLYALNAVRQSENLSPLPLQSVRPIANLGARAMIELAFGVKDDHPNYTKLWRQFIDNYQNNLTKHTRLFPNIDVVLTQLENAKIPWGIVTNKVTASTLAILDDLDLKHRAACIVCGDTLPTSKPDPGTILHALQLIKSEPQACYYVGDAITDVLASRAAGTKSLVALYGYIGNEEEPLTWQADGYVHEPLELLEWFMLS